MESILEIRNSINDFNIMTRNPTMGEELELVNDFIEFKKKSFYRKDKDRNLAIFVETKINGRYPDVVFIEYSEKKLKNLNDIVNYPLTKDSLRLYNFINYNYSLDNEEIYSKLNITWKSLLESLSSLYDNNLIIRENSSWKTINEDYFRAYEIEAFEAKIVNNKNLMKQAILNKLFSTKSYTLTPIKNKPHKETLDKYKSLGLGYYIQREEEFECINDAKKLIPLSYNSLQYIEWIRLLTLN